MTKRFYTLAVVAIALLVPSMVFGAATSFGVAKTITGENNLVTVPLEISNKANLTALDIPLSFTEGVTLKEVNFEGTRVEYFDLKVASIDNENRTVLIGLLPQMGHDAKPDLAAGTGTIANLVFEITDPSVKSVTVEAVKMTDPHHELTFVYHAFSQGGQRSIDLENPKFEAVTVALSGGAPAGNMPVEFSLSQNYPNPFNPTTVIAYGLPVAQRVNLTIYNVLGQTVATLVDGVQQAGPKQAEWNASDNSSGVYFYRLTTEQNTETRKMLLLK
ncbi:MAG: T9SS type A sorting domain-containing protein [candidate division Zixibacteria bacterium]|nr:T9SS type A sorting domain-containing protein [candidate division Zixibacteria bacterium]